MPRGKSVPERGSEEYQTILRQLGEFILEVNEGLENGRRQRLASGPIRKIAGSGFEKTYFTSDPDRRRQLLEDLHSVDESFQGIEVLINPHAGKSRNTIPNRTLSDGRNEHQIIENAILEYSLEHDVPLDSSPAGPMLEYVQAMLNEALEKDGRRTRTLASVRNMARTELTGRGYEQKFIVGSYGSRSIDDAVEEKVTDTLVNIDDIEDTSIARKPREQRDENRGKFLAYRSRPHNALLGYLLDPEVYIPLFADAGEMVDSVVSVDFGRAPDCDDLCKALEDRIKEIEDGADEEVANFVDGWLRSDVIYRKKDGGYLMVEVKARAINTPEFENADKARQQVVAYSAVLQSNIRITNDQRLIDGKPRFNESVTGFLIAYEIDQGLQDHLASQSNTSSIVVDREAVKEHWREKYGIELYNGKTKKDEEEVA